MSKVNVPMVGSGEKQQQITFYTRIDQDYVTNDIRSSSSYHIIEKNNFSRIKGGVISSNGSIDSGTSFTIFGTQKGLEKVLYQKKTPYTSNLYTDNLDLDLKISEYGSLRMELKLVSNVSFLKVDNLILE